MRLNCKNIVPGALFLTILLLSACGGKSVTPVSGATPGSAGGAAIYTAGGSVSGLVGSVILQDNGGDNLTVPASGNFTFATKIANGGNYSVTVLAQPTGQICSVSSGSGVVSGANITSVAVVCVANTNPATNTFSVWGTATGLTGSVVLQNNGGDNLTVTVNGAFTFATQVANGSAYSVTVLTQPVGQTCTVSGGTGTISGINVTTVALVCSSISYIVGGNISGLTSSVVLQNNSGDNLTVAANGAFNFATPLANGSAYSVTVLTQPISQSCSVVSGTGTLSGSNITSVKVNCVTSSLALLAGDLGSIGYIDGTGAAARFNGQSGVATDSLGNVYVADIWNNTIRKITPSGVVSTLAGTAGVLGFANGTGAAASFAYPAGVATDSAGNVYVADSGYALIRKITPSGVVSTLAGTAGIRGSANGTGAGASFNNPMGVATDSLGNVYVADTGNNIIRKITPAGVVSTLAGTAGIWGSANGSGAAASFNNPTGVATDTAGNVYVADTINCTIRKITPLGAVSTLAGMAGMPGSANGSGAAASFNIPRGVATDIAGNVYVADSGNNTIRAITPLGVVSTLAGTAGVMGSANGTGAAASFNNPKGVATDSAGNVYVSDSNNNTIRAITPLGVVSTLAGMAGMPGSANGAGTLAKFYGPFGVATDSAGIVYVADTGNNTIRAITPLGVVSTLAGTAGIWGSANGTGAAASFFGPYGVATDSAGNVYVADTLNNTIRKITPAGMVSTLAGTAGVMGSVDGTGAAASFAYPVGIATDSAGNVYVADYSNCTIRKITPLGLVTTLAGTAGMRGSADGTGAAARFNNPMSVATDSAGNVYVADTFNYTIRKITPLGAVSTLAGTVGRWGSTNGTGVAASFNQPMGVAADSAGNVYVADTGNSIIRKITSSGMVSTVVGVPFLAGFKPGALPGGLAYPYGVAFSGTSLYITTENGAAVVNNVP